MRALLFVLLLFPVALHSKPLRYEISPLFRDNTLRLQVRVWFAGDTDGETELAIPNQFGSADKLFRCIRNLTCTAPSCRLRIDSDTLFAMLEHAPGQELKLYYEVAQDFPGGNVGEDKVYRPIVQANYFHVLGSALFIAPKWNDGYDVTLEWRNFSPNWLLHNSFASQSATQHFSFPNLRWLESVFVGGDYRVFRTEVRGEPVFLAIRGGDWGFSDGDLLAMLRRMVTLQREFWEDFEVPYYTVTLTPLAPRPVMFAAPVFASTTVAYCGTGLTNSFAAFVTPYKRLSVQDLCPLFHHELMHDWIGCKIRNGGPPGDMQMAWFSEGFTEYFALKNMLKGGYITPEQYMTRLNDHFFDSLYHSAQRETPNNVISGRFFNDPAINALPYKRGFVFAFYLDNGIKAGSEGLRSLHRMMLDVLEYYRGNNRDLLNNFDFFLQICSDYLQKDVAPLYDKHIRDGKLIPAEEFILPPYLKMEVDEGGSPFFWLDKSVAGWESGLSQ